LISICDNHFIVDSPICQWLMEFNEAQLIGVKPTSGLAARPAHLDHHYPWQAPIEAYFKSNGKTSFNDFSFHTGTPFQHRVWHALQHIPSGTTQTYQQLAETLDTCPRAIGQACRANPYPLLIPCHRVVAKSSLGGYMGSDSSNLMIKQALIDLEAL